MRFKHWTTTVMLGWLLAAAPLATAQAIVAIEGTVTDRSGARLPGVTVEIVRADPSTAIVATATTDAAGFALPPSGPATTRSASA
jgi:hypothetical protein